MASESRTVKATCHCGEAVHEITLSSNAFPLPAWFCTCDSCRHMTGGMYLSCAFLPSSYKPSPALLGKLTAFEFSKTITQYFCKQCGAQMLVHCLGKYNAPETAEHWDALTGSLEQFDGVVDVKGYEYIVNTRDGGFTDFLHSINDRALKRWPLDFDEGSELPLYWRPPKLAKPPAAIDRLPAHCKCKGVSFYITRPSQQPIPTDKPWPEALIPNYDQAQDLDDAAQESWWLRAKKGKFLAGLCACDTCRLVSGMDITAWAFVPAIDMTLDSEGKVPFTTDFGTLKSYNSGPGVTRHFCSRCGATVFYDHVDRNRMQLLDVAVGLLAAPEGARAESWLEWRTERVSFPEDTVGRARSLIEGLENGLRDFRERGYGRLGPAKEVSDALLV